MKNERISRENVDKILTGYFNAEETDTDPIRPEDILEEISKGYDLTVDSVLYGCKESNILSGPAITFVRAAVFVIFFFGLVLLQKPAAVYGAEISYRINEYERYSEFILKQGDYSYDSPFEGIPGLDSFIVYHSSHYDLSDEYVYDIDGKSLIIERVSGGTRIAFLDREFEETSSGQFGKGYAEIYYSETKDLYAMLYIGDDFAYIIHSDLDIDSIKNYLLKL